MAYEHILAPLASVILWKAAVHGKIIVATSRNRARRHFFKNECRGPLAAAGFVGLPVNVLNKSRLAIC